MRSRKNVYWRINARKFTQKLESGLLCTDSSEYNISFLFSRGWQFGVKFAFVLTPKSAESKILHLTGKQLAH